MKKILIITSSIDETTTYIMNKYSNQVKFLRIDVDKFDQYKINIENEGWMIANNNFEVSSEDIYAIYYRKPMLPDLNVSLRCRST